VRDPTPPIIPADLLLAAYRSGIFPMSDHRDDPDIFWIEPKERAILPLDRFHCSHSLAKLLRKDRFRLTCNAAFREVMQACAAPRPGHPESWISHRIEESYVNLHRLGQAHSIECWLDGELAGGLYGVGFDRVFCGESMFSRARDASKVALAWLVVALRHAGVTLLDCQFMTGHLSSLGAVEVRRSDYLRLLAQAQGDGPAFTDLPTGYCSVLSAAGAGAAAGAGSEAGSAAAASSAAGAEAGLAGPFSSGSGASSPGKFIAQSLTQTS
jgi:leucyl/phenylalanyl-tRNA--protein transferase